MLNMSFDDILNLKHNIRDNYEIEKDLPETFTGMGTSGDFNKDSVAQLMCDPNLLKY